MTLIVESTFLSLFVHGFKRAESRDDLVVANLALRQQPWVAIYCKTVPNPLNKQATREHAEDMQNVKEYLQGKHGFESQEQCQWALLPPTDIDGFVSGKNWAIARVGDTSDVRKVEKQRLNVFVLRPSAGEIFRDRGAAGSRQLEIYKTASQ